MKNIDIHIQILDFITKSAPILEEMVNTKSLDEVADYFIENGIFHSKKDIKCFLFDAVPVMVTNKEINLDLPVRYYEDEDEIETDIEIPEEDNIINFVRRSDQEK